MIATLPQAGRRQDPPRIPASPLPPPPSGFGGTLSTDPELLSAYSVSRGPSTSRPLAVATPAHTDDVAALVAWARDHGVALIPRGAGTGMPAGNTGPGVIVDLGALSTKPRLEPGSRRVRAGAGVVAELADKVARSRGRCLPALPSSAPWCTVGGMVANDAAGARSFSRGPVHAWLHEVTWVRGDGTVERLRRDDARTDAGVEARLPPLASPWPQVRKNSSGYALDRFTSTGVLLDLVSGSEGTLGIVTEVVLDTHVVPTATGVALVGLGEVADLPRVAHAAEAAGATACEYLGRRLVELGALHRDARLEGIRLDAGLALLEFAGTRDDVARGLDAATRLGAELGGCVTTTDPTEAHELWTLRHAASPTIARAASEGRRSLQFIEDSVVPRTRVGEYAAAVEAILAEHETDGVIFGHLGDGNLHVNPLVDLTHPAWRTRVRGILDAVTDVVADMGGTLAGEHGDGRLRAPLLERIWSPDQVAAFRVVKDLFDPAGILNPGVILPLAGQDPLEGFAAAWAPGGTP